MLPSQVLAQATTFDMYVLDMHTKWLKYQDDIQNGRANDNHGLDEGTLKAMVENAKKHKNKRAKDNVFSQDKQK